MKTARVVFAPAKVNLWNRSEKQQ